MYIPYELPFICTPLFTSIFDTLFCGTNTPVVVEMFVPSFNINSDPATIDTPYPLPNISILFKVKFL